MSRKSIIFFGIFLWANCSKLGGGGNEPLIFPSNNASNVPVNAVIEVHFPKELGLTDADMKSGLFSINECTLGGFAYFDPKNGTNDPSKKQNQTQNTTEQSNTSGKTDETKDNQNSDLANSETKIGESVKFYVRSVMDSETSKVFNYLVVDPDGRTSPLKPATTYCVRTKAIKNSQGQTVNATESSFTTEDAANFVFDTQFDPEFAGEALTATKADDNEKDFVLLYLGSHSVRPSDVKKNIRVCVEDATQTVVDVERCGDGFNGKLISSQVYLVENLKSSDNLASANYNLYAITPNSALVAGQKYRILMDLSVSSTEESYQGSVSHDFTVVDSETYEWKRMYESEIQDGAGHSIFSPLHQFFFAGPTSTSSKDI